MTAQISIWIMGLSGLWLLLSCKDDETIERYCVFFNVNILPAVLGCLADVLIRHFFPSYTEMYVMLVGVIIVNALMITVYWPWRKEGCDNAKSPALND